MLTFSEYVEYFKAKHALSRFFGTPTDVNFDSLLRFLNSSPPYLDKLLSVKNKDGYNVLHYVVRHLPEKAASLLEVIVSLDAHTQAGLFSSKIPSKRVVAKDIPGRRVPSYLSDWLKEEIARKIPSDTTAGDWNVLELAARFQPDLVAPLLGIITTLDPKVQVAIFSRTNEYLNALQLAATHHPEAVKPLLRAIAKLENKYQNQIDLSLAKKEHAYCYRNFEDGKFDFYKIDVTRDSTVVARWTEEMIRSWMKISAKLSSKAQEKLGESVIQCFQKGLMQAANCKPKTVELMLKTIAVLGRKAQLSIVSYETSMDSVITVAKPEAMPALLQTVATFDPADQARILCYTNYGGNALQENIRHRYPYTVKLILELIAALDPNAQAKILCHKTDERMNALQMAVRDLPAVVKPLLAAIQTLEPAIQSVIFSNKNKKGDNAIAIASQECPEYIGLLKDAEDDAEKLSKRKKVKKNNKESCSKQEVEVRVGIAMMYA